MDNNEFQIARSKQRLNWFKFIIGSILLGIVGLIINFQVQQNQLRIQERKNQSEILKEYLKIYVGSSQAEKDDFLEFMKTVSMDEEERNRYSKLWEDSKNKTKRFKDSLRTVRDSVRYMRDSLGSEILKKEMVIL